MFEYSYENLRRASQTENGKKLLEEVKRAYESLYSASPIPVSRYAHFKLIYQTGDRDSYQATYYDKRKRFCYLQLLALADERYLEALEDVLNAILEEYTWVLPAHCLQKDNSFDYSVIDLFSAETGYYLAETLYVFGERLSADIRLRIASELKRKIIDNYENRTQLWEELKNNWAAVCAGSVGIVYLYAFPERFAAVKDRLFRSLENYLDGLTDEGVSLEGVGYWVYGFGFFTQFFDIYEQLLGERPELLACEKVEKSLRYIENACLGGKCYLPFADGGHKQTYVHPNVSYAAKRLFKDGYSLPEYYCIDEEFVSQLPQKSGKVSAFRALYGVAEFGLSEKNRTKENKSVYYAESQIFIYKGEKYSFAAKCGNNSETHNHNDVGSFQIVVDGEGVIVDPGPAKYTWQYFKDNEVRYGEKTFAAGSMGHSVPIVNGGYQKLGVEDVGGVLEVTDRNFKFDFAKAYDGVESLVVNYRMLDEGVRVEYDCKGIEKGVTFRFLSFNRPTLNADGDVCVGGVTLKSLSGLQPNVQEIKYKGHVNIISAFDEETIYAIDFPVNGKSTVREEFDFRPLRS